MRNCRLCHVVTENDIPICFPCEVEHGTTLDKFVQLVRKDVLPVGEMDRDDRILYGVARGLVNQEARDFERFLQKASGRGAVDFDNAA